VQLRIALPLSSIAVGDRHACAANTSGSIECWGDAGRYRLAAPRGTGKPLAVSAGGSHTCSWDEAGTVRCWGANDSGQLGTGSSGNAMRAVAVTVR
jgi:alpha-tubulin suppressor-like RCC1 family protein